MGLLPDHTAVITGAASGNGREMGKLFAEHGADVIVADIREDPRSGGTPTHEWIEAETDASATYVDCDVTSREDIRAAVDAADEYGGIDIMINNAGIFWEQDLFEVTEEDYQRMMDINAKAVFFGSQVAAERLVEQGEGGSIINQSSYAGLRGAGGFTNYCISKGGVRLLTYALADELAQDGIRVNTLHPGIIDTQMNREDVELVTTGAFLEDIPLGRYGDPEEVAKAALFLASDLASYVTGESLYVDGGLATSG